MPIPRVNANDDQVCIVGLSVAVGDVVQEGDLLAEIETTKAAAEMHAPASGTVVAVAGKIGQYVDVGATLFTLSDADRGERVETAQDQADAQERMITAKARRRAEALGVDLEAIEADHSGRVTVDAVERYAKRHAAAALAEPARSRFGGQHAVIIGGGGHAASVIDVLSGQTFSIIGCVDDNPELQGKEVVGGVKVIGTTEALPALFEDGVTSAFLGIGGIGAGGLDRIGVRVKVIRKLEEIGFRLPAVVSRHAYLGADSTLGPGTVLFPGAAVGPRCRIGAHVIVNQGAQICHDCTLDDHVHITPGALLGGHCQIGASSIVGMGASLLLMTAVGRRCLVHNNAAVTSDVHDDTEVYTDGRRFERGAV
ncbi:MAG: hypothetical protein OEU92_14935 [Alphaproteobacteria bacterium]|nr:hypothetical protein [Alphaproteobacteria bacterium]